MLCYLLLLQWLVVQSVYGIFEDAVENSEYGLPLLYHHGHCNHHTNTTLSVHIINTLSDYNTYAEVQLNSNQQAISKKSPGYLLGAVREIQLLLPDELATKSDQCLRFHCGGGGGVKSSSVCTRKNWLTGVTITMKPNNPTTLASALTRGEYFVNVFPLMPQTHTAHYTYYTLHSDRSGQFTVPTVGIMKASPGTGKINITLHKDTLVYKNKVLVEWGEQWTQLRYKDTVWLQSKNRSPLKITSTQPLSVFTGLAEINNSHFSYDVRYAQQMPATSQWGTAFIADLTVIEKYKDIKVSFSIIASNASTVHITTPQKTQSFQMEADSLKVITLQNKSSHMIVKGSQKLLILYEAYEETAEGNNTIFSTFLQPTEWYAYKQAVTLTTPSGAGNTSQSYYITLVVSKDASIYVSTSTSPPTILEHYDNITQLRTVDTTDYTLHTVTHHTLGEEEVLLFTARDGNGCSTVLGATLYASYYAHTNPPPLNDSSSQTESDKCRRLADHTPTIVAVSSSAVTLMTLLVLITVTIAAVVLMKPRLLFQKPDPPYKNFEYDVFLSFADGDKELVKSLLYFPLRNRGYKVLWHLSDFIAGLSIAENMLTAIKQSRWVIYVCSEYFEESHFCQQELRLGLEDHYGVHGGRYRRVIPLVLRGGTCPHKLKQLYPVQAHYERQPPTSKDIDRLIRRLCLGKSLKTLKEVEQSSRNNRVVTEETETLLNNSFYNTDV